MHFWFQYCFSVDSIYEFFILLIFSAKLLTASIAVNPISDIFWFSLVTEAMLYTFPYLENHKSVSTGTSFSSNFSENVDLDKT